MIGSRLFHAGTLPLLLALVGAAPAPVLQSPRPPPSPPLSPQAPPPDVPMAGTPAAVLAAAPASAWVPIDPAALMVIDLKGGGRVAIALAPGFAPAHVANIVAMARAGYYDGLWVERVDDGYVVQWGDPDGARPLPKAVVPAVPAEYERPLRGLALRPLSFPDSYAARVGWVDGWPVASDGQAAWLAHCYGMVGVGRDLAPDTGTGAELYAVIGQAPRQLDRNIAVVGRVVAGMAALTGLPRGTGALGFYRTAAERLPIVRVRMASDIAAADRPRFAWLDPASPSFAAWLKVEANRKDAFYVRPANAVDLCSALPPVRPLPQ